MVLEIHVFKNLTPTPGVEEIRVRSSEIHEGTLEELQAKAMMEKLAGNLGGYQIFDYPTKQDFLNANHLDWESHHSHVVEEDWDKMAMIQNWGNVDDLERFNRMQKKC